MARRARFFGERPTLSSLNISPHSDIGHRKDRVSWTDYYKENGEYLQQANFTVCMTTRNHSRQIFIIIVHTIADETSTHYNIYILNVIDFILFSSLRVVIGGYGNGGYLFTETLQGQCNAVYSSDYSYTYP